MAHGEAALAGRVAMVSYRGVLAVYLDNLNPVVVQITDALAIRWYGLAYLMAFLIGYLLLRWLGDRELWVLPGKQAGDFISLCALAGVFLGGRLGYVLFYMIPDHGIKAIVDDPMVVLRVWAGGMSSHGGILGIAIVSFLYARKHKVSWAGLGDGICVVAPVGLLLGRLANFVNGELFGRVAEGVGWAVKFPRALLDPNTVEAARFDEAARAAVMAEPGLAGHFTRMHELGTWDAQRQFFDALLAAGRANPQVNEVLASFLEPRHPSQLYEGLLEGLVLFVVLWVMRVRWRKLPNGVLTGCFFLLYAIFRIAVEEYRLPDSDLVLWGLTKGQFLSIFMLLAGVGFLARAARERRLGKAAS